MAFSGALTLTDLNDFISPSQACIKPVEQSNAQPARDEGVASTQIHIDSSGSYYEVSATQAASGPGPTVRKLETAQISLNDCLACSGCITSAESVLITMQSHEEVLAALAKNPPTICVDHKTPVLSISPQSLASLAATISSTSTSTVTLKQLLHRITIFAHSIGFEHVYDTTFARHLALLEHAREFHERKHGRHGVTDGDDIADSAGKLPMLASACPGWVCYAEKTHPEMLPFISRTKSPQQVMGTLVKNWLGEKWGKKPDKIYHVTVMPCYDKKLEASRQDFYNDVYSTRDVDCVITTGELELMMRERGWDLSQPVPSELSMVIPDGPELDHPAGPSLPTLLTHPGTSSGSYLHTLLTLQASSCPNAELTTRQVRSADFEEYLFRDTATGKILFKGARCYGFRNLQNVVRRVGKAAGVQVGRGAAGKLAGGVRAKMRVKAKVRRGAGGGEGEEMNGQVVAKEEEEEDKPYDYVEVMACPGGCVNGGGQMRPILDIPSNPNSLTNANRTESAIAGEASEMRWGTRAWTRRVEQAYWHDLPTPPPSPPVDPAPSPSKTASTSLSHSAHSSVKETKVVADQSACLQAADALALQVLSDFCLSSYSSYSSSPSPSPSTSSSLDSPGPKAWTDTLPSPAETRRRTFFRTSYRAVVSEVSGIQVQW